MLAERKQPYHRPRMRYRDIEGWAGAVESARYLWRNVPAETWERVGDLEAPTWMRYLNGANELLVAAQEAGLVKAPLR